MKFHSIKMFFRIYLNVSVFFLKILFHLHVHFIWSVDPNIFIRIKNVFSQYIRNARVTEMLIHHIYRVALRYRITMMHYATSRLIQSSIRQFMQFVAVSVNIAPRK